MNNDTAECTSPEMIRREHTYTCGGWVCIFFVVSFHRVSHERRRAEMQRIRLTATEQAHLEQLFKTTADRRLRDRCQAILMAHRGRQRKTIAQDLGVHRTTVRLWLKQDDAQGSEGIQLHWRPR